MANARQYLLALGERQRAFSSEIDALKLERAQFQRSADELERARERNRREMAGYLLPDLDDEDLVAVEKRFLIPSLRDLKKPFEAELQAVNGEREAIEQDPRFAQYDVNVVEVEEQLAEIAEACASFRNDRAPWEASKHFVELNARGWFKDDYDGGLWTWLRDWRAASLLMGQIEDQVPGAHFEDDDALKATWSKLDAESAPVIALQDSLNAKRRELDGVKARHAELVAAPAEIFKRCWDALAMRLADHLAEAPESLRVSVAKGDPQLAVFLKKSTGMEKQAQYLRELAVARIDPLIARLQAEERKTAAKYTKLNYKIGRGKYVQVPNLVSVRAPQGKWQKTRGSLGKMRERVATFDRYDRGSFVEDYLWWDLMTRGARGDDLYAVSSFHAQHPNWSASTFVDPTGFDADHRAAHSADLAAAATVDSFDDDDLSMDAS